VTFVAPELRKDVTRMQKILKMPQGITSPDADGLPVLERPVRKARAVAPRHEDERTTRSGRPGSGSPRRANAPRRSGATGRRNGAPGARTESRTESRPDGSSPKPRGPKPAKAGGRSAENRKNRREHLQANGTTSSPSGASRSTKRAGAPNPDKGKRRQPSANR